MAADAVELRRDAMVLEMARAVSPGAVCVQGLMTPLAAVALAVASAWHGDIDLLLTDGCAVVTTAPVVSVFGGGSAATARHRRFTFAELICEMVPMWQPVEFMRPAQLDQHGRSNNVVIRRPGRDMMLPGPGGIPEATNVNRNLYYYLPRHDRRTLVAEVDFVSGASFTVVGARPLPVAVFTELCTFKGSPSGLQLVALLPGVEVDDLLQNTGFDVDVPADVRRVAEPSEDDARLLNVLDPHRVRDLEFLGGAARGDALRSLAASDGPG